LDAQIDPGVVDGDSRVNYSTSGAWSPVSKVILMSVLIRGRHRLPVAIVRAIVLPDELKEREQIVMATKGANNDLKPLLDPLGPPSKYDLDVASQQNISQTLNHNTSSGEKAPVTPSSQVFRTSSGDEKPHPTMSILTTLATVPESQSAMHIPTLNPETSVPGDSVHHK
jgi:hypothetical protein